MEFFKKNPHLIPLLGYFFIILIAFLLFHSLQSPSNFPDPDSFYHAKIAVYLSEGKLIKDFPWLFLTILNDYYYDHHFLYHLFLIPFVKFFDPLLGLKFTTVILATLAAVLFYWLLRQFKFKFPFIFTFLLFSSPMFLIRLSLAKAPASALIFLFLGLYALFKRKYFLLLFVAFFYVWLYNTWPILFVAVIIYCFSVAGKKLVDGWSEISFKPANKKLDLKQYFSLPTPSLSMVKVIFPTFLTLFENFKFVFLRFFQNLFFGFPFFIKYLLSKENVKIFLVALAGFCAGLLINPYFPQNLFFDWVHIVKIGIINLQDKIGVGAEWYPYDPKGLIFNAPFVSLFFFLASAWFFVSFKKSKEHPYFGQKARTLTLFILSWLLFIYTIKSRRNIDYFLPMAILFSAFSFQKLFLTFHWRNYLQRFKPLFHFPYNILSVILMALLALNLNFSAFYFLDRVWLGTQRRLEVGIPWDRFKKVSEWFRENVGPNEVIFHSSWDDFPMLFYYNDRHRYIIGLDTTFLYEKNPDLYWDWQKIITGEAKKDLAEIIKNKFGASYVHVRLDRKKMDENISQDKNFEKVYEDEEGKVYKIR